MSDYRDFERLINEDSNGEELDIFKKIREDIIKQTKKATLASKSSNEDAGAVEIKS